MTLSLLLVPGLSWAQTPDIPAPPPAPKAAPAKVAPPAAVKKDVPPAPKAVPAPPTTATPVPAPPAATPPAVEKKAPVAAKPSKKKGRGGRVAVNPEGSTGLLRLSAADSVDPGLIRISFGLDFFSVGELFEPDDSQSRVGGTLAISGSPVKYLELWLHTRAVSANNEVSSPTLLQSLGDVALGVKGFYPVADIASVGADMQVKLLSGVGDTSFDFGASELRLRALMTADFSKTKENIPLRAHLNVGYVLDNSENLVPDGLILSEPERFGLGINNFNRFTVGVGLEVPLKYVTPYIEYNVEFPMGYLATPGVVLSSNALRTAQVTPGSADVALPAIQQVIPQVITPGIRITAIPKLTLDLAVEIGLTPDTAVGVPAVPAYNVVMFASYPLDPFNVLGLGGPAGPPVVVPVLVPEAVAPAPTQGRMGGLVKNQADGKPLGNAIVTFDRAAPVATTAAGKFTSFEMDPGPVKVTVSKPGFEPGTAELEVTLGGLAEIEVALAPSIKEGLLKGRVVDDKDKPVAGASVQIEGKDKKSKTMLTTKDGTFETKLVEDDYSIVVSLEGFLMKSREIGVKGGETFNTDILLRPRPKKVAVEIKGNRIIVNEKVHFVSGEARLAADSSALLDQVVDVLVNNKGLRIRIEGHTDNVGKDNSNQKLSQARAAAVRTYLADQGIDGNRLEAVGFGSSRPIAPNLTRRGREQNRRVEFYIIGQ